jgi:hypothetical protein
MKNKWFLAIAGVLTLGLAPFFPEPHFFGKVRWILGGAYGMQLPDYFDFLMHGAPWFYLMYLTIISVLGKLNLKATDKASLKK